MRYDAVGTKARVVWLAHEGNRSGANVALLAYLDSLRDMYAFHVILPHEGNMAAALAQRDVRYSVIHQYGWASGISRWNWVRQARVRIRSQLALRETMRLLRREKPALVFTNTLVPFVAAKAAYRLRIPHVWWIHEFGEEDFGFRIGWGRPQRAYERMQEWSRLIICNSKALAAKFQKLMPGTNIHYAYYPVAWNGNQTSGARLARFLLFGQIVPSKGHKEVLNVLARQKKAKVSCGGLHIKGPCENREYLEELRRIVADNDLSDEVKIEAGSFVAEEVMPLYEVLLVPSRSEAFGLVIVEAIKAGLKVVVRDNGGAPELVNPTNGLLYRTQDELWRILSGEEPLPAGLSSLNYSEEEEIGKVTNLLRELHE